MPVHSFLDQWVMVCVLFFQRYILGVCVGCMAMATCFGRPPKSADAEELPKSHDPATGRERCHCPVVAYVQYSSDALCS